MKKVVELEHASRSFRRVDEVFLALADLLLTLGEDEMVALVGLDHRRRHGLSELSGGQQQRTKVAGSSNGQWYVEMTGYAGTLKGLFGGQESRPRGLDAIPQH